MPVGQAFRVQVTTGCSPSARCFCNLSLPEIEHARDRFWIAEAGVRRGTKQCIEVWTVEQVMSNAVYVAVQTQYIIPRHLA